jgi:hypothetical protein
MPAAGNCCAAALATRDLAEIEREIGDRMHI